jgi:hypothetical protein
LDFGVFVTGSSSRSDTTHWLRATLVPRKGPVVGPFERFFTTSACPSALAQAMTVRAETMFLDALQATYGIQDELPW